MTTPRLLFGPYTPPPLRRGDRATCLFRDCDVVVTGWSSGRIQWPRCRALDTPRGGSGLLVDEELARAVRHEAAAAVGYWWGINGETVWRWRRALGVTRTNNEGSHRLMQAAAEAGAAAVQDRAWSPAERQQRRDNALRLGLKRYLKLGYHGPRWTRGELRLLGKQPDHEVAARIGRTVAAVRCRRELLGSPNPIGSQWSRKEIALLGRMPDRETAGRLGRTVSAVCQKRRALGIQSPGSPRRWTKAEIRLLGKLPDRELAKRTSRTLNAVRLQRGLRSRKLRKKDS